MVALFGYMPGWQGYVLARSGYVPGWQGYVVALLVESVPSRGGTCPVREVRARLWRCVPGREVVSCLARGDLQDLTDLSDLSDLSDIQDRLTPCQAIQHNTLSNQRRSSNLSKIIGQNEESNSLAFQILHIKVQSAQPEPPSARRPCPQVPQWHPRVAKGVFWPFFGTAPLSTGISVASPRGDDA